MRFQSSIRLPLLWAALASSAVALGDDKPGERALQSKGLTKVGTAFVIEDEKPVLVKFKEARSAFNAIAAMGDQRLTHEELALQGQQLNQRRSELQDQYNLINQQIAAGGATPAFPMVPGAGGGGYDPTGFPGVPTVSPMVAERERLREAITQVAVEQSTLNNQSPQPKDTAKLDASMKKADESFKTTLADLRKQVDEVKKKYTDLGADEAVKKPLAEAKAVNSRLHLGPSDALVAAIKELDKAEQRFLGKRTPVSATSTAAKKKAKGRK